MVRKGVKKDPQKLVIIYVCSQKHFVTEVFHFFQNIS